MKSKEEIEEQIGFKLEYIKKIIHIDGNDYNNFQWEVEEYITLTPESADRVKKLLIESLKNGDIETSNACEDILENAKINDIDLDDEFKSTIFR